METSAADFPVFYDWQELVIDDKKRLLLPADVRRTLNPEVNGPWLFMKPTPLKTLWLYPAKTYEDLGKKRVPTLTQGLDAVRESVRYFALASKIKMDDQGRILIPEKCFAQTGIGKEVVLAGMQDHLELWKRDAWQQIMDEEMRSQA